MRVKIVIIAAAVGAWTCSQKLAFVSVKRAYNGATSPTKVHAGIEVCDRSSVRTVGLVIVNME